MRKPGLSCVLSGLCFMECFYAPDHLPLFVQALRCAAKFVHSRFFFYYLFFYHHAQTAVVGETGQFTGQT